jgi:PHP family Zn ribbon phosphoesterase
LKTAEMLIPLEVVSWYRNLKRSACAKSLLYHASGTRGYYTRTDYQNCQAIFTIRQAPQDCRCSACGSSHVVSRGGVERRFRAGARRARQ